MRLTFPPAGALRIGAAVAAAWLGIAPACPSFAADEAGKRVDVVVSRSLDWLVSQQSRRGHWTASEGQYPAAMTALAGMAMLMEGSTCTQGKYAPQIRLATDYLIAQSRDNGLIGDPAKDDRYTYGHGFSMLFLSQVLGEEEHEDRREQIVEVLTKAVEFSGRAQTKAGGWGYLTAKDGDEFDEGSTTITQVQGLRGCRNAGIPVPKEIIDNAIAYIRKCTGRNGAVHYSLKGGGERIPITAAAIASLYNAGEYDDELVPRMLAYTEKHIKEVPTDGFGYWHYAHYYYSQVMYRAGGAKWEDYKRTIYERLLADVTDDGRHAYWSQGYFGPVYSTTSNLLILQLDKAMLPIYQR